MKTLISLMAVLMVHIIQPVRAQGGDEADHQHHHPKNEIGMSGYPVYLVKEKHLAYGLHMHYVRSIAHSPFGIGIGFERIFDEHKHNTIGIIGSYSPIDKLALSISPGISLDDHGITELDLSLHLEAAYLFDVKSFHLGPMFEFAIDRHDYHISLGLHVAIGF